MQALHDLALTCPQALCYGGEPCLQCSRQPDPIRCAMLTASGWPIVPGRRVRIRHDIIDHGSDCHPPGRVARGGEMLYVLRHADWIYPVYSAFVLSHAPDEKTYGGFVAYRHEVELYWEQPDLFPTTLPTTKEIHP